MGGGGEEVVEEEEGRRRRRKSYSGANAVNEEDPERDRATQVQKTCCAVQTKRPILT